MLETVRAIEAVGVLGSHPDRCVFRFQVILLNHTGLAQQNGLKLGYILNQLWLPGDKILMHKPQDDLMTHILNTRPLVIQFEIPEHLAMEEISNMSC